MSDSFKCFVRIEVMPIILRTLFFLFVQVSGIYGTDKVQTVLVTIPIHHPLDEGEVKFARIPVTGWDIDTPYYTAGFYSGPHVVFEKNKNLKQDVNLISSYKIRLMSNLKGGVTTFYVSTGLAAKPEAYSFSIKQVVEFTKKAVRTDYPDKTKYTIVVTEKTIKELRKMLAQN